MRDISDVSDTEVAPRTRLYACCSALDRWVSETRLGGRCSTKLLFACVGAHIHKGEGMR